jgi:DNA-binding beta-propeller fold protein YncE
MTLFFLVFSGQVLAKPNLLVLDEESKKVYSVDFNDLLKTAIEGEETLTLTEKNEISGINPIDMAITSDGEKAIFIEKILDSDDSQVVIRDMKTKTNSEPINVGKIIDLIHITPHNKYALLQCYDKSKKTLALTVVNIKDNQIIGEPIEIKLQKKIITTLDEKYAFVFFAIGAEIIVIDIEKQKKDWLF